MKSEQVAQATVKRVVIVGGGTAGWLAACVLAARVGSTRGVQIDLVESPDIATIGVGEGTWPTMRETLAQIGISETEFLTSCNASFKQGSRFDGWSTGAAGDSYLHPFTAPPPGEMRDLIAAWQGGGGHSFAAAMTAQQAVCAADLAPRQRVMPDYAGAVNYAYHLDAGLFAKLLARHALSRLGVNRIAAHVTGVVANANGDIAALTTRDGKRIDGDLFIDCSGQAALLIGQHYGVEWIDRSDVSFNDRALAAQVATMPDSAIASQTVGTAHRAGWLWDIALPTRRGIGCVYASRFMADAEAEGVLREYIRANVPGVDANTVEPRLLQFRTGYRTRFWHRNCVAIGLSAGFIEPLEASAIVLIELSLRALADNFPVTRDAMDIHAARFNDLFRYRWERIVDFLKLHYVLSERDEPYWVTQRDPSTVPARLAEQLTLWRDQPPSTWDFPHIDEIFAAASQQYVLFGMNFPAPPTTATSSADAVARLAEIAERGRRLSAALPTNRAYFNMLSSQAA